MFADILKQLRESEGLSQEQLASKIGVSKSTIGMYEQGKRMPQPNTVLKDIASYFNVTIDYLMGYTPQEDTISEEDRLRLGIRRITMKSYPMIGKISCGNPILCDKQYETYVEVTEDIDADFCLTAQGDSMINARIFDGDVVFIREQPMVENGEIAAVIVNDEEITLKRFYYDRDEQRVTLQPENPTYRAMVFTGEELAHIRVLGKAVAFTSKVI
ncbi:MAG: helix-turn-helix domain-containing protein [Clostridia bacterium]|nr:helix-turn-helix domain-containing protein [Clostridia bacterium]